MSAADDLAGHETGHVQSGDVRLFYRLFGAGDGVPAVILHGANYYDSRDWIAIGSALGRQRPVMARDARGFGESGWSASKDYSNDAHMADLLALAGHLGWRQFVPVGHSLGGALAILFASRFPERAKGLIVVDHCPGRGGGATRSKDQSVGNRQPVFATAREAVVGTSRDPNELADPAAQARIELLVRPAEGGVVLKRDPDFGNQVPLTPSTWPHRLLVDDMWQELANVKCPVLIVRATRSDRYGETDLKRAETELPHVELVHVESGHDVAVGAPQALLDAADGFLARL